MATQVKERTLEETPTWAVSVVCFVLVLISILIEYLIHIVGSWLKKKNKRALYEALEKVKSELMLMGFISLLLTVFQNTIASICIPRDIAATWHPCNSALKHAKYGIDLTITGRRLPESSDYFEHYNNPRRSLATKGYDKCANKGKIAFVSAYGIQQLHVFIFVLAAFHVIYCIVTYALGRTKMSKWKAWEKETKTIEYQYANDPERFRFARDTSFGRRHLNIWSKSSVTLWIVCFFRQFLGSVTRVDYLTLRHGFIMAHLAPGSATRFDFQKYIQRSLEEDFKVVVGISPVLWFVAVLLILTNTHGWRTYLWLPFIPLVVILIVGAKLQVVITKLGLRIQDKGDVVKGAPVVQPGDDLFWFGRPRFILYLIHLILFTNAFQLAFFIWSTSTFKLNNCFHHRTEDIVIRIVMGIIIQIVCSYVTLPLYALVTQMGSTMRPTIFNDRVSTALKNWHNTAKKHTKHGGAQSESHTPRSSRPATPSHGMSPVHLLNSNPHRSSFEHKRKLSPSRFSDFDHPHQFDPESQNLSSHHEISDSDNSNNNNHRSDTVISQSERSARQEIEPADETKVNPSEFTFKK